MQARGLAANHPVAGNWLSDPEIERRKNLAAGAVAPEMAESGLCRLEPDGEVYAGHDLREIAEPERDVR